MFRSRCASPPISHEAETLTGRAVHDPATMVAAGEALLRWAPRNALIKGGHLASDILVDILVTPNGVRALQPIAPAEPRPPMAPAARSRRRSRRGSRRDVPLNEAVELALGYVQDAIRNAPGLGGGIGPLWHGVEAGR